MSFDVVTIGSATQDVFLISKNFNPLTIKGERYNVLEYGSKVEVEDVVYDTGGGATNAAVTFARQGLHTACIAKLGVDGAAREIVHVLTREKVSTEHLIKSSRAQTGFSVLLKPFSGDRTVLVHRGASRDIHKSDLDLGSVNTKWLYITSLGGDLGILKMIIDWANRREVYVAINPGTLELKKRKALMRLLKRCQVVILNLDEAAQLTQSEEPKQIINKLHKNGIHIALLTDGGKGSYALYGDEVYRSGVYKKVRVVDRAGSGDAYGSGFVAALARGKGMEEALSFAAANATSVVTYVGTKTGILKTHDVHMLKIKRHKI